MKSARLIGLMTSGLAFATTHSVVWADQLPSFTIDYAPVGSIPTLSEWGMLILAGLLAVTAVFSLRKKVGSKTLLSIGVLCALGLGSVMGNKMIGQAQATSCEQMSNSGGGTLSCYGSSGTITNTTSVPLQIIRIIPTSDPATPPNTTCVQNLIVQAGGSCYVSLVR